MRITLTIDGEAQLDRAFNRVKGVIEDLTPVWKTIETQFFEIQEEQFDSEGAKGASGKWKELSPVYLKAKLNKYGSMAFFGGILYATGRLQKSLTRHTTDTLFEASKQEMAIGTAVPYALYHHRGGGNLPQRRVIDLSNEQKQRLQKSIQKELLKIIKQDRTLVVDESNFREVG